MRTGGYIQRTWQRIHFEVEGRFVRKREKTRVAIAKKVTSESLVCARERGV